MADENFVSYTNENQRASACLCAPRCLDVVLERGEADPLGIQAKRDKRLEPDTCIHSPDRAHEPEGRMLFCLGNVTNLLDVTPSNTLPHPLSTPSIPLSVI